MAWPSRTAPSPSPSAPAPMAARSTSPWKTMPMPACAFPSPMAWAWPMCATGSPPASTARPASPSGPAKAAASAPISLCRFCAISPKAMTEALRTLIVDDEPLAIERLQLLCAGIPGIAVAGTAAEGGSALRLIESLKPDLLLLDIQMPGMDGMALAKTLAGRENHPAVIFITAFDRFAVAAFDVAAVDYLLKPVEADRLERAVSRIRKEIAAQPAPLGASRFTREFWVPHRSGIVRIAARDIDLIEAERDYMRLHVGPRSYLLHETITELERQLDPAE